MRAWLGISLAIAATACTEPVALGTRCERSGECAAPLVCQSRRCREECIEHRDCPLGARCIEGNDGIGVCTLPDDRCDDAANACGEGLECRAESCYDPCPSGSCPAGGVCTDGVCERPSTEIDAGTGDAGSPYPERRACTTDEECGAGSACASIFGGRYACHPRCATSAECGATSTAITCGFFEGVGGANVSVCTLPCDLLRGGTGCFPGEACDALELSSPSGSNGIGIDCRPVDPAMRLQEQPCTDGAGGWDYTLCAPGYDCDGTGPDFVCQQLCSVSGAIGPPCPVGTTCQAFSGAAVRFEGATIGSCDPG